MGRHPFLLNQIEYSARVYLTTTCAHRQPVKRGKPHGGPDAFAYPYGAHRRAISKMSHDDAALMQLWETIRDHAGHIVIAEPVKPVATDAFIVKGARQGKDIIDPRMPR